MSNQTFTAVTAFGCRMKSGPRRSGENVHDFNIQKTLKQNNKRENESEQFCQAKNTKQKTRSHKTQKENDNLYMIPNQRQQ